MSHVDFPYRIDARGGTARTDENDYVRDLIEQLLFTAPGERVNRPDFGSAVMQLVFAPNNETLAATTESTVKAALQQWIADVAEVETIRVTSDDTKLQLEVSYRVKRSGERRTTRLERAL
ncbi:GPW/gp25 family protein [Pelagibius sp.]|uniref:GPW/gp25 family protein n=1 Tax=Pelagibius sp. TaxID=1931238 RepID=UPI002631A3FE|nr:GPW/gp25 family protein [Pelagibius sp.]